MTRLLSAEFRKVTTVRLWWVLGLAALLIGLLSSVASIPLVSAIATDTASDRAGTATIGLFVALGSVFLFAALFGAVNAGAEYRHGTLADTFLSTRGRDRVVAAKLAVTVGFGLLYCLAVEIVTVPLLLIAAPDHIRLDATILAVLGAGLLASALWALLGAGLALATASATGSAVGLVAWYVFGEATARVILSGLGLGALGQWLPASVTVTTFRGIVEDNPVEDVPGWQQSILVLALWAAVACGLGWWTTRRRDIT